MTHSLFNLLKASTLTLTFFMVCSSPNQASAVDIDLVDLISNGSKDGFKAVKGELKKEFKRCKKSLKKCKIGAVKKWLKKDTIGKCLWSFVATGHRVKGYHPMKLAKRSVKRMIMNKFGPDQFKTDVEQYIMNNVKDVTDPKGTAEEIYDFVQRKCDINKIKKKLKNSGMRKIVGDVFDLMKGLI